jgi:hypothetical protein
MAAGNPASYTLPPLRHSKLGIMSLALFLVTLLSLLPFLLAPDLWLFIGERRGLAYCGLLASEFVYALPGGAVCGVLGLLFARRRRMRSCVWGVCLNAALAVFVSTNFFQTRYWPIHVCP